MSTVTQATVNHAANVVAENKISDRPQTGDTGNLVLMVPFHDCFRRIILDRHCPFEKEKHQINTGWRVRRKPHSLF